MDLTWVYDTLDYVWDVRWHFWVFVVLFSLLLLFLYYQFSEIIVPTMETVRQSYFLHLYISHETPSLYVGPTGTGKTAITNGFLIQLPKEKSVLTVVLLLSTECHCVARCWIYGEILFFLLQSWRITVGILATDISPDWFHWLKNHFSLLFWCVASVSCWSEVKSWRIISSYNVIVMWQASEASVNDKVMSLLCYILLTVVAGWVECSDVNNRMLFCNLSGTFQMR